MIHRLGALSLLFLVSAGAAEMPADLHAVFTSRCLNCHSTEEQKGDLDLVSSDLLKEPQVWENVIDQIRDGEMPPKKEKQLSEPPPTPGLRREGRRGDEKAIS